MEALFGVLMVLTFTNTFSVIKAGNHLVDDMLLGAVCCNLACGLLDGCFFILGAMIERSHHRTLVKAIRGSHDTRVMEQALTEVLPEFMNGLLAPADGAKLRERILDLPEPKRSDLPTWADIKGALAVLLWVLVVTFPVVLPFVFLDHPLISLRVSNGLAIIMLGVIGQRIAAYAGFRTWPAIIFMMLFGTSMVLVTIALGG